MNLQSFIKSITETTLPVGMTIYLQSLWYDGKGNWEKSHELIQELEDKTAARIHAYLHRKEGDQWNADYWYQRAGKKRPSTSFNQEWEELVTELLLV